MLRSIAIEKFRGLRDLGVDSLDRVNLTVGANDVGKAALLEAIFLLVGEANLTLVPRVSGFRGVGRARGHANEVSDWFWSPPFYDFALDGTIAIDAMQDNGLHERVELKLVQRSPARVPLSSLANGDFRVANRSVSSRALQIDYTGPSGRRGGQMTIDENDVQYAPPPPEPSRPGCYQSARGTSQEDDARIFGEAGVETDLEVR